MKSSKFSAVWVVLLLVVGGCNSFRERAQRDPTAPGTFFRDKVQPILCSRCIMCHNDTLNNGGISFMHRETVMKRVEDGVVVVPGNPEQSVLIHAVRQDGDVMMPPGSKLSAGDIASLTEWVKQGAPWTPGALACSQ